MTELRKSKKKTKGIRTYNRLSSLEFTFKSDAIYICGCENAILWEPSFERLLEMNSETFRFCSIFHF